MKVSKKSRGRPRLPANLKRRKSVTFWVTDRLYGQLSRAAARGNRGRSKRLSAAITDRLDAGEHDKGSYLLGDQARALRLCGDWKAGPRAKKQLENILTLLIQAHVGGRPKLIRDFGEALRHVEKWKTEEVTKRWPEWTRKERLIGKEWSALEREERRKALSDISRQRMREIATRLVADLETILTIVKAAHDEGKIPEDLYANPEYGSTEARLMALVTLQNGDPKKFGPPPHLMNSALPPEAPEGRA